MLLVIGIASRFHAIYREYVEIIEALRCRNMNVDIVSDNQRLTLNLCKVYRGTEDERILAK